MTNLTLFQKLNEKKIRYFVTGSYAVYLYTFNRSYNDIDIAVGEDDLEVVAEMLGTKVKSEYSAFGQRYSRIEYQNMEFGTFVIKAFNTSYDFGIASCFPKSRKVLIDGFGFNVIGPEDLILLKLAFGREDRIKHDLEDSRKLLTSVELDYGYLVSKAKSYGLLIRLANTANMLESEMLNYILLQESRYRNYFTIQNNYFFN